MNIAATLRQHDIVEDPPIILCECSRTQETRSEVRPTPLPHPSRLKPSRTHYPLVSVLSPTTMDRHWSHANLYHCFQQQTWPNKELVVLDLMTAVLQKLLYVQNGVTVNVLPINLEALNADLDFNH